MKNKIEQVTNLERETRKYVPRSCFDSLYYKIKYYEETEEYLFCDDVRNQIEVIKAIADADEIEKPIIPDDPVEEPKRQEVDICPYCGSKMVLKLTNGDSSNYSSIRNRGREDLVYVCSRCGSRSPWVGMSIAVIDKNKFDTCLEKFIDSVKEDIESEDDDEMF